jgi:signal recognition particle receptor subunit beta
MAVIDVAAREIHIRIVYYGPGLSGKTTNLAWLYEHLPVAERSELVSIDTEQERTLFFDFLPLDASRIGEYRLRTHLYSVPGQDRFGATRSTILRGVDGIVFVADAQRDRVPDNQQSLQELRNHIARHGRVLSDIPLALQYNKSDLTTSLTRPQLDAHLNPLGLPSFAASAVRGEGVVETLRAIVQQVIRRL